MVPLPPISSSHSYSGCMSGSSGTCTRKRGRVKIIVNNPPAQSRLIAMLSKLWLHPPLRNRQVEEYAS